MEPGRGCAGPRWKSWGRSITGGGGVRTRGRFAALAEWDGVRVGGVKLSGKEGVRAEQD